MKTVKELVSQQGLSSLERPEYSQGLLLEDEDLRAGVVYTREMMRLMFRSLFGCGVICGLDVKAFLQCNGSRVKVAIGSGLALDCMGNPIHVPEPKTIIYDLKCEKPPKYIWVTACYVEKRCRLRDVSCSPDDETSPVHTRSRDAFEIKLYDQFPECACSCGGRVSEPSPPPGRECCPGSPAQTGAVRGPAAALAAQTPGPQFQPLTIAWSPTEQADPAKTGDCSCYKEHYEGVCACACCCNCVVLARIQTDTAATGASLTDSEPQLEVDDSMRRRIRPVLVGLLPCLGVTFAPKAPPTGT